MAPPEA